MITKLIQPFRAIRVNPSFASEVLAPPYDVIDRQEALRFVEHRPWSFLHIAKAEIDLPPTVDQYDDRVYAKARENYELFLTKNILKQDQQPAFYIYRLTVNQQQQTGIFAAISVEDYVKNRVKKHELTRPEKENDRVRHIDALNAHASPVLLTYRPQSGVARVLTEHTSTPPVTRVTDTEGVTHELWVINDAVQLEQLQEELDHIGELYIADGHHRTAAAAIIAQKNPQARHFLAALFPANELTILGYHRVVKDLHGYQVDDFMKKVGQYFTTEVMTEVFSPTKSRQMGLYLDQQWYKLEIRPEYLANLDPVAKLDVSLLAKFILEPLLGITDPRRDKRIDFIGGSTPLEAIAKEVDVGNYAMTFILYPTQMQELLAVADALAIMPPKSTWFFPKLADGLVCMDYDK